MSMMNPESSDKIGVDDEIAWKRWRDCLCIISAIGQ